MKAHLRLALLTFSTAALIPMTSCTKKQKKPRRDCAPAVQRAQKYFAALCKAQGVGLADDGRGLAQVKLTRTTLTPVRALPKGPLVILGNRRLVLHKLVIGPWADYWKQAPTQPAAATRDPKPTTPKAGLAKDEPRGKTDRKRGKPKPSLNTKGRGVLKVLKTLDKVKLDTLFDKGPAKGSKAPRNVLSATEPGKPLDNLIEDKLVKLRRPGGNKHLLLAIAADTPAEQVVALLDLVRRAGYQRVSFVLAAKSAAPGPADPGGPDKAMLQPGGSRPWKAPSRSSVAAVLKPWADKGCATIPKLITGLQKAGRITDCERLAAQLKGAITSCGCPVDEGPLLSLVHRSIPPLNHVALHTVTLSQQAPPTKVTDGGQPWSKLFARVQRAKSRALRLTGFVIRASGGPLLRGMRAKGGPQVLMQAPEVAGGLDKSVVRRVVRRHLAELRYCYMSIGLVDKPKLAGLVKVIWTVAATGKVLKVSIGLSELNHDKTEACIKGAVRRWRFPKPTNSMPFITYPFLFKPKSP